MWEIFADELSRQLPDQSESLHLSFRLASAPLLKRLFLEAGYHDVSVNLETREGIVTSFEEYWAPIEAGIGQLPQAYLALPESNRREVRAEVQKRLSRFESDGHYVMSVQMLLGSGRA
jgi:hypothetical protein